MRPIGFSTGALCYSDFREALQLLASTNASAVELSALRQHELAPLMEALPTLPLTQYRHISLHLPSLIEPEFEARMLESVRQLPDHLLLVTHPNVITFWDRWAQIGNRLCIENMDKRKAVGQTASDLCVIFERLPQASFCFDIGHAHQVDPTMGEAVLIIEQFKDRLRQVHISEVNSDSKHDPISVESAAAFSVVAHLIPESSPAILESRLSSRISARIQSEMDLAAKVLSATLTLKLAGD